MHRINLSQIIISILTCLCCFILAKPTHAQSAYLENVSAVLSTIGLGQQADITINFRLPVNAKQVNRTDYLHFYMPNFANFTLPAEIEGPYTGEPQFIISEPYFRITNMSIVPGATMSFKGIGVRNPLIESSWPIYIVISEDAAGTIIKNRSEVMASLYTLATVSVSASIDIPQAQIFISGITAPETYVTFTQGQAVIGTDMSGLNGNFGKLFPGLDPNTYQITYYGTDKNRLNTSPITATIYAPPYQQTNITDQILSPTISINKSFYIPGEPLIASGSAVPNGSITLFTQSPLRTYFTTADAEGEWSYTINNTASYVFGDYHIYALVQSPLGLTSLHSPSLGFTIASTATGTACGDITKGDLNCDGVTDLTDFSILMYYWGTNNASADINTDNIVNLADFSIMMYWWGDTT